MVMCTDWLQLVLHVSLSYEYKNGKYFLRSTMKRTDIEFNCMVRAVRLPQLISFKYIKNKILPKIFE